MRLFPDKDFLVKFCQEREEEFGTIIDDYEKRPTQNSSWEVAIAYFGTDSLYDVVTEIYGYQESFPNDDEPLFMPEELYKLVIDQDQEGEFFYPIEDDEDLAEENIHEESFQEDFNDEDPNEIQHPDEETLLSMPPLDEDDIIQNFSPPAHEEENMMSYNPFENFNDALFHDFGNEENCQKDLNEVSLAEGLNETHIFVFPFEENEVLQLVKK
jgi:hypothetical protein